ncbi:MAG TPA: peptidoglycan DD-metalloendopeptidase family protein [Bacteroidales bacterium]|nr:peptidoglycan DD-metalloendopeptidase family protein [Bacteroidales bacterium]
MKLTTRALLILSAVILFSCNRINDLNRQLSLMPIDTMSVPPKTEPVCVYGIPADSYDAVSGEIKRNSFISDILLKYGVSMPEIDQVLHNSASVFDVRKVLPGKTYTILCERNDMHRARYMIYDHDPSTTYIFSFNDSLNITAFRKETTTEVKYAKGTINSSLWQAIMDGGMPPALAVELGQIFQWSVDFFGLEEGDNFKVVYEEKYIEDKPIGIGKILTAQFTSSGQTYTAIPFIQDGQESYFDTDGKSLRKAFLKAPLKFSRISSRFTSSRFHPVLKIRRPHYGVDYAAPTGTPVHAVGDGKVLSASYDAGSGRIVKIKHNATYTTAYMHLSRFGEGITAGKMVKQGDVIGYVGSTGLSTGPHLDFRFYQNGSPIDPLKVIAPPSEPVSDINRQKFEMIRQVNLDILGTF